MGRRAVESEDWWQGSWTRPECDWLPPGAPTQNEAPADEQTAKQTSVSVCVRCCLVLGLFSRLCGRCERQAE